MLRLPSPATPGDIGEQIGLGEPEFQEIELAPVVFRKARPVPRADGSAEWELLVSAACIQAIAGSLDGSETRGAAALFASAQGVVVGGVLMKILLVTSSDVSGKPCVYRLVLQRPASQRV